MHLSEYRHFLTFVISSFFKTMRLVITALTGLIILMPSVQASPAPLSPDLDQPLQAGAAKTEPAESIIIDTINITPVAPLTDTYSKRAASSEYFFPYRKGLSPRLGTTWNSKTYAAEKNLLYTAGFQFRAQTRRLKNYEIGIDLVSDSTGRLNVARHWYFSRSRFRPFAKAGGTVKLIPRDGLATVLRMENYFARGAIGFEQLLLAPLSFRLEMEAAAGIGEFEANASAGYSWAW